MTVQPVFTTERMIDVERRDDSPGSAPAGRSRRGGWRPRCRNRVGAHGDGRVRAVLSQSCRDAQHWTYCVAQTPRTLANRRAAYQEASALTTSKHRTAKYVFSRLTATGLRPAKGAAKLRLLEVASPPRHPPAANRSTSRCIEKGAAQFASRTEHRTSRPSFAEVLVVSSS